MVICCHYSLQEHPYTWMTSWTSWWVFVAIKATFLHWRTPFIILIILMDLLWGLKKYMTHLYLLQQDDKGCWWPALGMFWGAKIMATFFGQFKVLDNFDCWTILIFRQFWIWMILIIGWFWFWTILTFWTTLIFGQFLFLEDFDFWMILIFGRFWFLEDFDFWTILIFGPFWFLDNFDFWTILTIGQFWFD